MCSPQQRLRACWQRTGLVHIFYIAGALASGAPQASLLNTIRRFAISPRTFSNGADIPPEGGTVKGAMTTVPLGVTVPAVPPVVRAPCPRRATLVLCAWLRPHRRLRGSGTPRATGHALRNTVFAKRSWNVWRTVKADVRAPIKCWQSHA